MASSILLNDKVRTWLDFHNVSLDDVHLDSDGSHLWPPQVSGVADLLKESTRTAVATVNELVSTLDQLDDQSWVDDPAPSVLSALAAFPELPLAVGRSSHLPLPEALLWTIVEGIFPALRVFYHTDFTQPRCDTGNEELNRQNVHLYGKATFLVMKEFDSSDNSDPWDYIDDDDDFVWRNDRDDLSELTVASVTTDGKGKHPDEGDVHAAHDAVDAELAEDPQPECRQVAKLTTSEDYISEQHLTPSFLHSSPLVPILCVADEENIVPLLSSALLQRRELNIVDPVVGILLPRTGSSCQVLFGWMEELADRIHALPRIHVVYSHVCDRSETFDGGFFDLTHRQGLMHLIAFLTSIREYSQLFHVRSPLPPDVVLPILPWRADTYLASDIRSHNHTMKRTWVWLHSVPDPRVSASSDKPRDSPESAQQPVANSQGSETSAGSGPITAKSHTSSQFVMRKMAVINGEIQLRIRAKTQDAQRQGATVGEWLWDHSVFTIEYIDPHLFSSHKPTDPDHFPHMERMEDLLKIVSLDDSFADHIMDKLKSNLLQAWLDLVVAIGSPNSASEVELSQMATRLLQVRLGPNSADSGGSSLTTTDEVKDEIMTSVLAKPRMVYMLGLCHKLVVAYVAKKNANEAQWRQPWDILHESTWLASEKRAGKNLGGDQPFNYYICPEAMVKYMRCEEYDYGHKIVELASSLPTNPQSAVAAITRGRLSGTRSRGRPQFASTTGMQSSGSTGTQELHYVHARHHEQFLEIANMISSQDNYLASHGTAAGRTAGAKRDAEQLAKRFLETVASLKSDILTSSDPATQFSSFSSQVKLQQARLSVYPKRGTPDCTFALSISGFRSKVTSQVDGDAAAAADFVKNFSFLQLSSASASVLEEALMAGNTSRALEIGSKLTRAKLFDVPNSQHLPADDPMEESLLLPYYIVDYKLNGGEEKLRHAENQRRMSTASAVAFLRTIGITDFPVYGLAHAGPYHTVSMTWYCSADKVIYMCDGNVPGFNMRLSGDVEGRARFPWPYCG
ncbi:hypothetical protein C8T65DRAFT_698638 [Cerioporus squamosus]|nr:hypothetical protein C8T65DRAFT_698638 [Cerioporus squamosus]